MVSTIIVLVGLIYASDLVSHKFYQNFGEIFYDYSGNSLYSVNGQSSQNSYRNTLATDRGAYFPLGNSIITLPPNDVSDSLLLESEFSIVFWILPEDYTFYCLYCSSSTSLFYLRRFSIDSKLSLYFSLDSDTVIELNSASNSFNYRKKYLENWHLVILSIKDDVRLTIDKTMQASQHLSSSFYMGLIQSCKIGKKDVQTSLVGYIWTFYIKSLEESYYSYLSGPSTNCLVPGCSSCTISVIENSNTGCIPIVSSPYKNSLEESCNNCQEGCNGSTCLACNTCQYGSCEFVINEILCACPENSTATESTCICADGEYFDGFQCLKCLKECATCSNSMTCNHCISSNSLPKINGCECKTGYYNTSELTSPESCIPCNPECLECDSTGQCTKCKISNALPSQSCLCQDGFYTESDLCEECYAECSKCDSYGSCTECVATLAEPEAFGCKCIEGYGGKNVLAYNDSCVKCHSDCNTCSQVDVCDTCILSNSVPGNIGCTCKDGYFFSEECLPCFSDCRKCNLTHCLECWDELAQVNGSECFCPDGTFKIDSSPLRCQSCREDCDTCTDGTTCETCKIIGAIKKNIGCMCETGYYSNSVKCIKCSTWSDEENTCLFCNQGTYFENGKCLDCPLLCTSCEASQCLECTKNSELLNGACICSENYQGSNTCELKTFEVIINIDSSNNINLQFTLEPSVPIDASQIKISVPGLDFSFQLIKFNPKSYKLAMTYPSDIIGNYNGQLVISSQVMSIFNTTLSQNSFDIELIGLSASQVKQSLNNTYTAAGSNSLYVAMSISLFLSLFNMNFISFWNFLNTIQLLIYIRLLNIYLPPKFDIILKSLFESMRIVNAFNYFIDKNLISDINGKFYNFGFKNSLIFLNSGNIITIFICMVSNNLVVVLFKKITTLKFCSFGIVKKAIGKLESNFKYNAYIRFIIQSYLDLGITSLFALLSLQVDTVIGVFNYLLSLVFFVLVVFTPVKTIFFMNKHKDEIKNNNQELMQHYGSFFYEVSKDHGLLASYFYVFFFAKRLVFIVILFSLGSYPLMQLVLSFIINTSVITT